LYPRWDSWLLGSSLADSRGRNPTLICLGDAVSAAYSPALSSNGRSTKRRRVGFTGPE
jgi:hypothetical protein